MNRMVLVAAGLAIVGGATAWVATRPAPAPESGTSTVESPAASPAQGEPGRPSSLAAPPVVPAPAEAAALAAEPEPVRERPPGEPGVNYDFALAPTAYWASARPPGTMLRRKPTSTSERQLPLAPGAIVEVLEGEGFPFQNDAVPGGSERMTDRMLAARHSGVHGWVQESHIERLASAPDDPKPLWAQLVEAAGISGADACAPAEARADVHLSPGPERIVYSAGVEPCRHVLGVFSDGPVAAATLLGWTKTDFIHHFDLMPYAGRPAFIATDEQWMRSPTDTGTSIRILAVPDSPGPLVEVFGAVGNRIDSTSPPGFYELSRFAYPDLHGNGQWLVQWRLTKRRVINMKEVDEFQERVYAFNGTQFAEVPMPEGLRPLPAPEALIREGSPDDVQPDLKGYPEPK